MNSLIVSCPLYIVQRSISLFGWGLQYIQYSKGNKPGKKEDKAYIDDQQLKSRGNDDNDND